MASQRLLRLPDVKRQTGLSRSSIYGQISDGKFPQSVSIGARAVAWVEDEVEEWINKRIDDRRRAA